jgi:biotin carboxyl carrier protein
MLLSIAYSFSSCINKPKRPDDIKPRSTVAVTTIKTGAMVHTEQLSATAQYLRHNTVTAPVAGYVHFVKINFNDRVAKGQLLYTLETKERKALGDLDGKGLPDKNYGLINVYAPMNGVVISIPQSQTGIFVPEGSTLCDISDNHSLYFQVNIPYEYIKYVKKNASCIITLPDNTSINARLETPIMQANTGLQTIPYMAKPEADIYIPESIIATAKLITYRNNAANVLPKGAVLSDELMKSFWVMKLMNDSTAIKVPVMIGEQNDSLIEIKRPLFDSNDKILVSGNYGLGDTMLVKVL